MIEELATVVDALDVPIDADGLAAALDVRDRLEAKIVTAVCAFEDTNEWDAAEGCASLAAWLRIRGRMTGGDARRLARTARRLRRLPTLRSAWLSGTVSGGHVAAVVANLNDRSVDLFARQEDDLVPVLAGVEVGAAVVAMKAWAAHARELLEEDLSEPDPDRSAHLSPTLSGGRLDANLEPEAYHAVEAALRLAMGTKTDDDPRTLPQRRHDALAEVAVHYLDHQSDKVGGRHRPHLNVTIGLDALTDGRGQGSFHDGIPITATDARRLACDASLHRVITRGDGSILDYGRATRTVSAALFTVLALRDRGCRFPGCDRTVHRTDAHHIRHWIDGGQTDTDNLVLLCRWHHGVVHRPDWTIELRPDTTVIVTSPDGRRRTSSPPRPDLLMRAA
ncbi:MAG TPA: DUF222 domain-containing protein [Iamia sp.]|nr:DUF222 domain-containing protein [Iamia sp.]